MVAVVSLPGFEPKQGKCAASQIHYEHIWDAQRNRLHFGHKFVSLAHIWLSTLVPSEWASANRCTMLSFHGFHLTLATSHGGQSSDLRDVLM